MPSIIVMRVVCMCVLVHKHVLLPSSGALGNGQFRTPFIKGLRQTLVSLLKSRVFIGVAEIQLYICTYVDAVSICALPWHLCCPMSLQVRTYWEGLSSWRHDTCSVTHR